MQLPENPQDGGHSETDNISDQSSQNDGSRQQEGTPLASRISSHRHVDFVQDCERAPNISEGVIGSLHSRSQARADDRRCDEQENEKDDFHKGEENPKAAAKPDVPGRRQGQAASSTRNIKLVGIASTQMSQNPAKTTFSAADLPLPTYGKTKSNKKRRGNRF
jgi:hypothetical protein